MSPANDPAPAATTSPAAPRTPARPADPGIASRETGGPTGPEPTRYGDWERGGRCIDF